MLRIGLTGGIGSGKSAATKIFASLGIQIVDADCIAKDICCKNSSTAQRIAQYFGPQSLQKDGELDRAYIASIIFKQKPQREWLNALLHPLIAAQAQAILHNKNLLTTNNPYIILVAPLLIEAGWKDMVDQVCVIDLPETLQKQRLLHSRNLPINTTESIIACQMSRDKRLLYADDVINNQLSLADLRRQVLLLDTKYRQMSKKPGS